MAVLVPELKLAYVVGFDEAERAEQKKAAANYVDLNTGGSDWWNGHVIVLTDDFLLDPSFDQCSVPAYGLTIPPFVLQVPIGSSSVKGQHIRLGMVSDDGMAFKVEYLPVEDVSFRKSDAWQLDPPMEHLALYITYQTLAQLSGKGRH